MNEVVTINTESYATMAKAMGLPVSSGERKVNVLNRFRIWHEPTMGIGTMDGKEVKMEVIKGGCYRLEKVGDVPIYYFAEKAKFRPFLQRFMYKRYHQNDNKYCKSIMADTLSIDLKDDYGTFNCGKPTGYVKDYQSLPESTKNIIKAVDRYRVVFGIVELEKPVKLVDGKEVQEDLPPFPAIWEMKDKNTFKSMGEIFSKFSRMERLPLQHNIQLDESEVFYTNNAGTEFFKPTFKVDYTTKIDISEEDHKTFGDFLDWVKAHNDNIVKKWDERVAEKQDEVSEEDAETVEQFIDVELESDEKQ